MKRPTALIALLAAILVGPIPLLAGELISVDFESGSLAPTGSAGDGWKFWSASGNNRATIGSTGRTFLTGTPGNDEALFIRPATPGATESDLEGAEFTLSTPITVNQNDIVYIITETFSDISAFSDQFFKVDTRFGLAGDGGAYGGFDSAAGGSTWNVNSNFNTEPSGSNRQARISSRGADGSALTAEGLDVKYIGDDVQPSGPDNTPGVQVFLDRTFVQSAVYRPQGDNVLAEIQGFDGSATYNREGTVGDGNALEVLPAYGQLAIDRVSVHLRRHVGFYDGILAGDVDDLANGFAGDTGLSSTINVDGDGVITNPLDILFGIKSLRIGVADPLDINLDGTVDGADLSIVVANQGLVMDLANRVASTFFDGDVDNDGDVDADDLAQYTIPGDFNSDVALDCLDVDALVAEIAGDAADTQFDLTGDGNIDGADLSEWLAVAGARNLPSGNSYLEGDANLDGAVDVSDFEEWNANKFTSTAAWCSGDFNADGAVDVSDFNLWNVNKFQSAADVASVPEPHGWALALMAMSLVALWRRMR